MRELETQIKGKTIRYQVEDEAGKKAIITGGDRLGSRLEIPEEIDGYQVTAIDKKAFLGNRLLSEVVIPRSVNRIMDYSFAQCPALRTVVILNPDIKLSRGTFVDCRGIENICVGSDKKSSLSALTAALVHRLKADYILTEKITDDEKWYYKWDIELKVYLGRADDEEYTSIVLCGEEDVQFSQEEYVNNIRKGKCALCFIRLMNDDFLMEDTRAEYVNYLLSYTKGCECDAAWQALLSEFADRVDYFKLFADIGGITNENLDDMLIDMGGMATETKAFLLEFRQNNQNSQTEDVFDMFKL